MDERLMDPGQAWVDFEARLTPHLGTMHEGDDLVLRLGSPTAEQDDVTHVVIHGEDDQTLRMTMIDSQDDEGLAFHMPRTSPELVATNVIWGLRRYLAVSHPQLLTYSATGPASQDATTLGLCATAADGDGWEERRRISPRCTQICATR